MGGWNKGIRNSTGTAFRGKKHTKETIQKLKSRPKDCYRKPIAIPYVGNDLCSYGCEQAARYIFKNGKLCCNKSPHSCIKKRKNFSNRQDHIERAHKSLKTRTEKGITKSSRKKAVQTMTENGTYDILADKMRDHWASHPWNNNLKCPITRYKNTEIHYQGSFEYTFLEKLEEEKGLLWLERNVKRGPNIWYVDPVTNKKRLYISDFLIGTTIYEIKSSWTWNKHGKDLLLEQKNKAKFSACIKEGYDVILVLNGEKINASTLGRGLPSAETHGLRIP